MAELKTIWDHRSGTPQQHMAEAGACVALPGLASVPVDAPPTELGIYPAGVDVEPPVRPGEKVVSRVRQVVGGKSVLVVTTAAMSVEESEAAEVVAEDVAHPLAAQAKVICGNPDAIEAVQLVLSCVSTLATMKVDISDWSFEGAIAAAKGAAANQEFPTRLDILTECLALLAAWQRVIYHCGDVKQANDLWPYLYSIVVPPVVEEPEETDPTVPAEPIEL